MKRQRHGKGNPKRQSDKRSNLSWILPHLCLYQRVLVRVRAVKVGLALRVEQ